MDAVLDDIHIEDPTAGGADEVEAVNGVTAQATQQMERKKKKKKATDGIDDAKDQAPTDTMDIDGDMEKERARKKEKKEKKRKRHGEVIAVSDINGITHTEYRKHSDADASAPELKKKKVKA